jgi:hypothetical protein
MLRNVVSLYGKDLLAPRPTSKLEDHPLLAAREYLVYSQLPSITGGHSSMCNLRTCHAMVTGAHLLRPAFYMPS